MAKSSLYPKLELTSIFRFGKYKGKLCSDVLAKDCRYLRWVENNTTMMLSEELKAMLEKEISENKRRELERYQDSQRTEVSVQDEEPYSNFGKDWYEKDPAWS